MTDRVTKIGFSGTRNLPKMGLRKVKQGFYLFFGNFLTYLVIIQSGALRNFEKSSNMPKNEEKLCPTCLNPISPRHFQSPKPAVTRPGVMMALIQGDNNYGTRTPPPAP